MARQNRQSEIGKKWRQPRRPKTLGRPGGRGTKYRPIDHCQAIWEHLAAGHTIESFGAVVGVCKDTVYEWLTVHPEFAEAREFGELARAHLTEKIGLQQAVTGRGNYSTWIVFASRYLGWQPPNQSHTLGGNGNPVNFNINSMTPEQKKSRIDELLKKREQRDLPQTPVNPTPAEEDV